MRSLFSFNSDWGDLLTSYGTNAIIYDGIGNPLTYYNGKTYNFTWNGRMLMQASCLGNTISFSYNDDGIRTSKTVNGVTTTYYIQGSQIIAEETNGNMTLYVYDASGGVIGMQYHAANASEDTWEIYWFEKNLFGDVVAIYSANGTKLASYTYDAWGNFTATYHNGGNNTVIVNNPFTYRGYYYDKDLFLYYLGSRYYDSSIGRFVSEDSYISTGQGISANNMFVYCGNNPITRIDANGKSWCQIATFALFYFVVTEDSFFTEDRHKKIAEVAKINDQNNGTIYMDGSILRINTQYVLNEVRINEFRHFYDVLYANYLEKAEQNNIPNDERMSKLHIVLEFEIHILGYAVCGFKNCSVADLNYDETLWSLIERFKEKIKW